MSEEKSNNTENNNMKQILSISCDDLEFQISIEGDNRDLLAGILYVLKQIEKDSGVPMENLLQFMKHWKDEDEVNEEVIEEATTKEGED